jgi:23S rRNA pseudoU1915 N3-methylase RlmH
MTKIRFIGVGKFKEDYVKQGIDKYLRKMRHYAQVEYEEVKAVKHGSETIDKANVVLTKLGPS